VFQSGACLFLLTAILGIALAGFGLTFAICLALREVVPEIVVVILSFPIWLVCTLGLAWGVARGLKALEERQRQRFLQKPVLSEEEFCGHFDPELRPVAAVVRQELAGLLGNAEVSGRLGPGDPIRQTCLLLSLPPDDLDWVEWLMKLEARFGARVPHELAREATCEQLVRGLAQRAAPGEAPPQSGAAPEGSGNG
jgi:hypothetical protein